MLKYIIIKYLKHFFILFFENYNLFNSNKYYIRISKFLLLYIKYKSDFLILLQLKYLYNKNNNFAKKNFEITFKKLFFNLIFYIKII